MTSEYYRALFSGQLGFEKIAEFSSYVNIGPFWFPDQESTEALGIPNPFDQLPGRINAPVPPAEEAFSVYDHPRVVIFRKTDTFSPQKAAQILGQYDLAETSQAVAQASHCRAHRAHARSGRVGQAAAVGDVVRVVRAERRAQQIPGVGDLGGVAAAGRDRADGLAACRTAWPALPDRGWGLARTLGLLMVAYLGWLAASLRLLTFSRWALLAFTVILIAIGAAIAAKRRAELTSFLRQSWRLIVIEEAVFAVVFAIFLLIRYGNGDLWHFYLGGERPMDFCLSQRDPQDELLSALRSVVRRRADELLLLWLCHRIRADQTAGHCSRAGL